MLVEAVTRALDASMFDAAGGDSDRPAGLLNGVSPLTGYAGGDAVALIEDISALAAAVAPVAAGGIVFAVAPDRLARLSILAPAFAFPVLASTQIAPDRVIAVVPNALAASLGGIDMEASAEGMVHMEQEAETVAADVGGSTTPVRAFFQTDSVVLRMIMEVTWGLRGPGVAWTAGATW